MDDNFVKIDISPVYGQSAILEQLHRESLQMFERGSRAEIAIPPANAKEGGNRRERRRLKKNAKIKPVSIDAIQATKSLYKAIQKLRRKR